MSGSPSTVRCAAVQLHAVPADVDANVAAVETALRRAARDGAEIVVLPEFFTTGVAYRRDIADAAQPVDGPVAQTLTGWAAEHDLLISGSMLIRDDDAQVRNAQLHIGPDGLLGRHDKDLPTMWENALYVGGHDDGRLHLEQAPTRVLPDGLRIGAALCWELTRRDTVHRLAGQVDLVLAGSGWWSVPQWWPRALFRRWERANADRARQAAGTFARLVAAPVVHAAHVGDLNSRLPGQPGRYRGHFEGGTGAWNHRGERLAMLPPTSTGPGTATSIVVDVPLAAGPAPAHLPPAPPAYWLTRRGVVPTYAWHWQRLWGRRAYRVHHAADRLPGDPQ